jgi:hypothetical protein
VDTFKVDPNCTEVNNLSISTEKRNYLLITAKMAEEQT